MKTKFTNKQEYLKYRSEWKSEYKKLSQEIRDAKFCKWYCSLRIPARITPNLTERFEDARLNTDWNYYTIFNLKETAKNMLLELKEAKIESHRLYLELKSKVTIT